MEQQKRYWLGMPISQIISKARVASRQVGRSVPAQLLDIVRLRRHGHGVLADIYFDLRLFEPDLTWRQKSEYVGSWVKPRLYRVQEAEAARLFSDKLRALSFFREQSIPTPEILAATNPSVVLEGVTNIGSPAALEAWILNAAPVPFFCKPAVSYKGFGNKLIRALDRERGELHFADGTVAAVRTFAEQHGRAGAPTMVFQEVIKPHPDIAALIGPRLATARFMVLNDGEAPEIYRVGLRLPAGNSMVDNFRGGASGNMLARLDPDSGVVVDVLSAIRLEWSTIDQHPDTGMTFAGFQIPDWDVAVDLVKRASAAAPGLLIHNWDVAFTDAGPVLLEDNPAGDFGLPQLVARRGLATPRFLKLYESGRI